MSGVVRAVVGVAIIGAVVLSGGIGAAGLAVASGLGVSAAAAASIVTAGLSLGASLLLGAATEALAGRPRVPQQVITGNVRGSSETHLIVFGERRVGGKIIQLGTSGSSGENLFVGVAHSVTHAGGCEGITGAYFNDVYIPASGLGALDGSSDVTAAGGVNSSTGMSDTNLAGQANLAFYRGTDTQVADPASVAAGVDTSTDYRRRICWTRFLLKRSSDSGRFNRAFPSGIPTVNVVLRGWRCYDPRMDTTAGGFGSQRVFDPLTWTWTRNPALCAATYYIAPRLDGACGRDPNSVDWISVAVAANICDETITTPVGVIPRFRCDIVLDTKDPFDGNLQKILDTMGGSSSIAGGLRKFYAAAYRSPTVTIDETWISGGITYSLNSPIDGLVNTITAGLYDETQNYKQVDTPPYTIASALAADGERLDTSVSFDGVTRQYGAQYLNHILLKRSRRQETLELPCNLKALDVEALESVRVSIAELGLVNRVFRVSQWRWDGGLPLLRLRADDPNDYTPETFTVPTSAAPIGTTPEAVGAPTNLVAVGITDGVATNWRNTDGTQTPDPLVSVYAIERTPAGVDSWTEIYRANVFSYVDHDVVIGSAYSYRVRAVNRQGQSGSPSNTATATATSAPSQGGTNVVNPGFEAGDMGWDKGADWTIERNGGTAVGAGRHTGDWAARHNNPSPSSLINQGYVAAAPGDTLSAAAFFKWDSSRGGTATAFVSLRFYDETGMAISPDQKGSTCFQSPSGDLWRASQLQTAVAPAGSAFARIILTMGGLGNADDARIDVTARNIAAIPDGGGYSKTSSSEVAPDGKLQLATPGSNSQLGDQRNMNPVATANTGSRWDQQNITYAVPTGST